MKTPNLFLIGAQKSGSTSFFDHLVSHPDIVSIGRKEPNIFNAPTPAKARSLLAACAPVSGTARYILDGSVNYTRYPLFQAVPATIAEIAGRDIRLVYLLRHPVERLISEYFFKKSRYGGYSSIDKAIDNDMQMIMTGQYDVQIKHFMKEFDRDKFFFVLNEAMLEDTKREADRVFSWLDLAPVDWQAAGRLRGPSDKTKTRQFRFAAAVDPLWRLSWLRRGVRSLLPERTVRRLIAALTVEVDRVAPSREQKKALLDRYFIDSIRRTEDITGLDLGHWLTAYN